MHNKMNERHGLSGFQLAALRLTPFRSAMVDSFLSAAL
jgi:hypothetical protein